MPAHLPSRSKRPNLDLELFVLQPRAAGVMGSGVAIVHFLDARQRTVRDALAVPVRISQGQALRKINVNVGI